jgi:hypothetical protein
MARDISMYVKPEEFQQIPERRLGKIFKGLR